MISKKFNFKKGEQGSTVKKLWKEDRDQGNELENANKLEDGKKLKIKFNIY